MRLNIGIILIFFFFVTVNSACANNTQIDGKCTQCIPTQVLIGGSCFLKIRGCLRYSAGLVCAECQNGYVLSKSTCIRQAEFFNRTNLSVIPPVVISTDTLNLDDFKSKVGEKYGLYASQANGYFTTKYSQLQKSKIKNVEKLETKKGVFLAIEYQGINKTNQIAVGFFNITGGFKQWSFTPQGNSLNDPIKTNLLIKSLLNDRLNNTILYQFNQQSDTYIYNYMQNPPRYDVIRVVVNKNQVQADNLLSKLRIRQMSLAQLALQIIIKQFPAYKDLQISSVQKFEDYFVISLGRTITVSFSFINYDFLINKPLQNFVPVFNQKQSDVNAGGYSNFTNFVDPRFGAVIDYLLKQFPEILGSQIVRAQSQIVAGVNFIINLKKSIKDSTTFDDYQFRAFYSLQKTVQVTEGKKNNKMIFSIKYNYNLDSAFFSEYKQATSELKIANVPRISSVTFKSSGNRKYYKIIYSDIESFEFEYFFILNQINLVAYNVEGENILLKLGPLKILSIKRSPQILLAFIKSKQEFKSGNIKIKQIIQSLPLYTLIIITSSGTYTIVIEDKGGEMELKYSTKLSDISCYSLSTQQMQSSSKINTIHAFLKDNYPLENFNLKLVQTNVEQNVLTYRLLYANPKLQQIQFSLSEINDIASLSKAFYVNNGYFLIESNQGSADIKAFNDKLFAFGFTGNKTPFLFESNNTFIKAYYQDGKSIIELVLDKSINLITTNYLFNRNYVLLPEGFSLETFILPGNPTSEESETLNKISQEVLKRYQIVLRNSSIVYADKKGPSTYLIMYKNNYGYLKIECSLDSNGKVTLGRLIITGYKETDFSSCKRFSRTGICQSCDYQTEIQYQGSCYKRLEGCLIQAGPLCIKCNVDYVKSEFRCFKECSLFFK